METLSIIAEVFEKAGFANLTLKSLFLIALLPISMVYLFGRCLNLARDRLHKNVVAVITIAVIATLELFGNFLPGSMSRWLPIVEDWLFLICLGVFVFVVFFQRFYDRFSGKLTEVIGPDGEKAKLDENGFPIKTKRKVSL
jgi:hypothetical protein